MRDFAEEMRIKNKSERNRQDMIDKVMCKPGYTWNETVGRCLGPAGGGGDMPMPENPGQTQSPPTEGAPPASPQQAIAKEVSSRAMKG